MPINSSEKEQLKKYIYSNCDGIFGEHINISLIEKIPEKDGKMKLNYGLIKNHSTYLLGKIENNAFARVNYGYVMEKLVIKATELGIDSCWVGYFDHQYFNEFSIENNLQIPALVIIGKGEKHPTITERLMSSFVKASSRNEWRQLFYNEEMHELKPEEIKDYVAPLEMLRLAPSAGNLQPWRVMLDRKKQVFHFYKVIRSERYEESGLHDIDLGIAISHFDLICKSMGLKGEWLKLENSPNSSWNYVLSWKCS
jgi:nitroreductase